MKQSLLLAIALVLLTVVTPGNASADNDTNKGQQYFSSRRNDDRDPRGHGGYGGGTITRVDVCRATGSKFLPYVKITVPSKTAQSWVDTDKAVWPDTDGMCPKAKVSIREYIRNLLAGVRWHFPSFAHR